MTEILTAFALLLASGCMLGAIIVAANPSRERRQKP